MAETASTIELPDCDYESLLELFRYLCCDKVNLTGSNVMQVFYLAKKYLVLSLVRGTQRQFSEQYLFGRRFEI